MRIYLDGAELTLAPDTDEDKAMIGSFINSVENNDNTFVYADMDGVNLDELVLQPFCKGDASHCQLCGRANSK